MKCSYNTVAPEYLYCKNIGYAITVQYQLIAPFTAAVLLQ